MLLLTGGDRVEKVLLPTGSEERGQPMPSKRHESLVVLGGPVEIRSLLAEGGCVETGSLLDGVKEEGQPMPSKRQRSPVVLGGGC